MRIDAIYYCYFQNSFLDSFQNNNTYLIIDITERNGLSKWCDRFNFTSGNKSHIRCKNENNYVFSTFASATSIATITAGAASATVVAAVAAATTMTIVSNLKFKDSKASQWLAVELFAFFTILIKKYMHNGTHILPSSPWLVLTSLRRTRVSVECAALRLRLSLCFRGCCRHFTVSVYHQFELECLPAWFMCESNWSLDAVHMLVCSMYTAHTHIRCTHQRQRFNTINK